MMMLGLCPFADNCDFMLHLYQLRSHLVCCAHFWETAKKTTSKLKYTMELVTFYHPVGPHKFRKYCTYLGTYWTSQPVPALVQ